MEKQPFILQDKAQAQPFQVPEGFFDDFQASLARHIDTLEAADGKPETTMEQSEDRQSDTVKPERPVIDITWREKLKPYLYFAAMFVLMFFTVKGIMSLRDDRQQELAMQTLDVEEVSTEEVTAEDILMSELDSYNLMYYLYGEDENE